MIDNKKEMVKVILCKPNEVAELVEINDDLESMQELVGGLVQEYMPFHSETDPRYDDIAIVCNEEGKLMRLPPSRAITDEDGRVMDVIAGPFFICYAPLASEKFLSMPEDLEHEFTKRFEFPEHYFTNNGDILVSKYDPQKQVLVKER